MSIATSADGQWAAVRRGRDILLFSSPGASTGGAAVGRHTLGSDDETELAFLGAPALLAVVHRGPTPAVELLAPPYLEVVARHDLDQPMRLAATTGQRMLLSTDDSKTLTVIRGANRSLAATPLDAGAPIELAVGLDRNQLLLSLPKKLEVWDAVSTRPLLRLALQLPPPPRTLGSAHGHLWVTRPGSDEVFIYRLSDGRPFRHFVGAKIDDVVSHPASPLVVFLTVRGIVRLHCFAHSLTVVDSPWTPGTQLGQLVNGDDVALIGIPDGDNAEPWRVPIGGTGAAALPADPPKSADEIVVSNAADKLRQMRERPESSPSGSLLASPSSPSGSNSIVGIHRTWRDPLATFGLELSRGVDSDVPTVALDTELGNLANRLSLSAGATKALVTLYALYLVGDPAISIARASHALGDWTEPLGRGDLAAHGLITRHAGKLALRERVAAFIDGAPPQSLRLIGGTTGTSRPGVFVTPRAGKSDAEIETTLANRLGQIAVVTGRLASGIVEAHLRGLTAVALTAAPQSPVLPRDASLVVVTDDLPDWLRGAPAL